MPNIKGPQPFSFKSIKGKYKGVSWNKSHEKYTAQITLSGKQINLGLFDTEVEAARAYNDAATIFGRKFINLIETEDLI